MNWTSAKVSVLVLGMVVCLTGGLMAAEKSDKPWVVYEGKAGPGVGKHIVFVTGDEEYRSEESMPMLAKILAGEIANRHGVLRDGSLMGTVSRLDPA